MENSSLYFPSAAKYARRPCRTVQSPRRHTRTQSLGEERVKRRVIRVSLTDGEQTVSSLVDVLGLSQPLVSQHLRVLRSARLVTTERHGREIAYSLSDDHVAHVFLDAFHHTQENHDDDH